MIPLRYLDAVRGILTHLETTQLEAVESAADLVIAAMTQGGAIFCAEIGHSNQADFLNRAGGLAALQPFSFNFGANAPVAECLKTRPRPESGDDDLAAIRFAVHHSNLRAGDVLFVGSVSGKNRRPVEMALACRDLGVRVVGFTSFDYTAQVESLHPSGHKLKDVSDVAIDIGAPFGDGAVEIPGYDFKLLPVSGVSMIALGWMIWGRVMEKMAADGNPPSVFMSINRPGGPEYYEKSRAQYQERGY
jgi:uncharacterized phosphosugar-binding protein